MDPESEDRTEPSDDTTEVKQLGCGTIIFRVVIVGVVVFIAAVAFVFGACLLA